MDAHSHESPNRIVALLGNSGAGKTALAEALHDAFGYPLLLESHAERPYQVAFMRERERWGFHNQVDYLLHRAEQERAWQAQPGIALSDGGLDLDFIFTRFFHSRGYLSAGELAICERLYAELRRSLGVPLLFLHLSAPIPQLVANRARRARPIDVIQDEDLPAIEESLQAWLTEQGDAIPCLTLPSDDLLLKEKNLGEIDARIRAHAAG